MDSKFCSLDAVGDDALFLVESGGHVANDVFDELRMIVGVFRDVLLRRSASGGPKSWQEAASSL